MTLFQAWRFSTGMLSRRDNRILWLLLIAQAATSLLDLVGVMLIALVTASLASSLVGGEAVPTIGFASQVTALIESSPLYLVAAAVGAGLLLLMKSVISFLIARKTFRFLAYRQAAIAGSITRELMARPLSEIQVRSSQDVATAVTTGVQALTLGILGQGVSLAGEASLIIALVVGLILVDPAVTVFSVLYFILVALLSHKLLSGWARRNGLDSFLTQTKSLAAMQNLLRAYREILVMGRRDQMITDFEMLRWQAASVQADAFLLQQVNKYLFEIALVVGAGLLMLGTIYTSDFVGAAGLTALFLAAASRLFPSIQRMQAALVTIRSSEGVASSAVEMLGELNAAGKRIVLPNTVSAPRHSDNVVSRVTEDHANLEPIIVLKDVSVDHSEGKIRALSHIDLQVSAGSSLAIVGATGSGKSTLADVMLGVISPSAGSVTISGVSPVEAIKRWPGSLAYVPQTVTLIRGSVRDNVALGLGPTQTSDDQLWRALERAHLADYLSDLREGLDTQIGEDGVQLSGGQRQRLGIARALLEQPRILVLDEATSALDAETESAVVDALQTLTGGVTVVVIAHRLAAIMQCDQVAYLSEGRLQASGTFAEVRRSVPEFDRQATLMGIV